MAAAIADIGILDSEPGTREDAAAAREAVGRLTALADRAPETFTTAVIDLAIELIEEAGITALLGPLRHLARRRAELAVRVLAAALISLDSGPVVEAGRCVADLIGAAAADPASITSAAVRSLIMLAGAPEDQPPVSRYRDAVAWDVSGLRAVADHLPASVTRELRAMLPPPARRSTLTVPPGSGMPAGRPAVSDLDRISAANAGQGLASTHPDIAAALADASSRISESTLPTPTTGSPWRASSTLLRRCW